VEFLMNEQHNANFYRLSNITSIRTSYILGLVAS
jgi:hypothetical protein